MEELKHSIFILYEHKINLVSYKGMNFFLNRVHISKNLKLTYLILFFKEHWAPYKLKKIIQFY